MLHHGATIFTPKYRAAQALLGRDIISKVNILKREQEMTPSEINAVQKNRLYNLLKYCSKNIPFYQKIISEKNIDIEKIKTDLRFINQFPMISKEDLINYSQEVNKNNSSNIFLRRTNGSTGLTLDFFHDIKSLDWAAATNIFISNIASGKSLNDKELLIIPKSLKKSQFKDQLSRMGKSYILNRSYFMLENFDSPTMRNLYDYIRHTKPHTIHAHPSSLYHLALFIEELGLPSIGFGFFESTGETIKKKQIKTIKDAFGCKVINRYGCAEFGLIAFSRADTNQLETIPSLGLIESVQMGNGLEELVYTGFTNYLMPLIRYKTGDLGVVDDTPKGKIITNLRGRVHDTININDKTFPTFVIEDFFENMDSIKEFQFLIQDGKTTLRIATGKDPLKDTIARKVMDFLGKIHVEFISPSEIETKGWREKFSYIIQK